VYVTFVPKSGVVSLATFVATSSAGGTTLAVNATVSISRSERLSIARSLPLPPGAKLVRPSSYEPVSGA
jgi:hypothetical protein